MWIRSQGKTNLVNASQVKRIRIYYFVGKISVEIHADDTTLGEYSTEEKALKVLDMIQELILYTYYGGAEPKKVFQIPQDSEVE